MNHMNAESWNLRVVAAFGASLPVLLAFWMLDPRILDNGDSVWLKPMRFSLAFAIHLLTLAWLSHLLYGKARLPHRSFALGLGLQVIAAVIEWACIVIQSARGVHSHFNYATFFDHAIFTVMGLGTAVLLAGIVLNGWAIARSDIETFAKRLLLLGIVLAIFGGLIGVLMVMPTPDQRQLLNQGLRLVWLGGTTVGLPSGDSLPFFGWDLLTGDWRSVHFVGLHALQALPLLSWLCLRTHVARRSKAVVCSIVGASAYASFFGAVAIWTAHGHSLFAVEHPQWWWVAAPGLIFLFTLPVLFQMGRKSDVG
jgi:hypothetical protein